MVTPFPWVFPYVEEPRPRDSPFRDRPLMRPAVPIGIVGPAGRVGVAALVDSGADHVLAAPWVAQAVGCDLGQLPDVDIRIGGGVHAVRFTTVELVLGPPDGTLEGLIVWEAEVGFFDTWEPTWPAVLGQVGFFDRFTVTMSRQAMLLSVEEWDAFDERFGVPAGQAPGPPPRFKP